MGNLIAEDETPTVSLASNSKLRKQARDMYYAGIYPTEIIEHLNLDPSELHLYVFGVDGTGEAHSSWAWLKQHRPPSSAVTYERVKPFILKGTEAKLLNRIRASVDAMESRGDELDMDDMGKAMGMVEKLDKITRLEEGKATAISETHKKTFTLRDISAQARDLDEEEIEDAEYTEVASRAPGSGEGRGLPAPSSEEAETPSPSADCDGGAGSDGDSGSET